MYVKLVHFTTPYRDFALRLDEENPPDMKVRCKYTE